MNVGLAQIKYLEKVEGTSYWHSNQWFNELADYSNEYDAGSTTNVTGTFRSFAVLTPNRRNMQKLRDFIVSVSDDTVAVDEAKNGIIPAVLKAALLAHLDKILSLGFKSEYRYHFSEKNGPPLSIQQVSAASCFRSSFWQAVNYPK